MTVWGVDGCPGGWACVALSDGDEPVITFQPSMEPMLASGDVIAIDIPMGLPERVSGPGRAAEQAVRPLLGARQSSMFSMPGRAAIYAPDYAAACAAALATSEAPRKVSRQAFLIFPKIRELDGLLTVENQGRVFECHAELAFWRLNGDRPMPTAKRARGVPARQGLAERIALLARAGIAEGTFARLPHGVPLVDAVDAAAIALIARRCERGEAVPFPDPPGTDARGLRVAIWA